MADTTNSPLIALFDGIGESVTPTANFTPPSGFPLVNLRNSELFDSRTRTPDLTTNRQLTWDLGVATEFNVFALFGTNASLTATGQLEAADNAGFSVGLVQSTPALADIFDASLGFSIASYVPPWGRSVIAVLPASISKRYVRWHQTDVANPDGYQEWAVMRLGLAWQPAEGIDADSFRITPKSVGPRGGERTLRGYEMTFAMLSRAEAYDLQSLALSSLTSRRMLVIPEPLKPDTWLHEALWCTMEGAYVREPVPGMAYSLRRYRVQMTFREADH